MCLSVLCSGLGSGPKILSVQSFFNPSGQEGALLALHQPVFILMKGRHMGDHVSTSPVTPE